MTLLHYFFPTTSPGGRLAELPESSASAGASGNPRHPLSKTQESIFSYIDLNYETPLLTTEDTPASPLEVAE